MKSPFAIGEKWYCEDHYPPFYFVIIGKGEKPYTKLCRLENANQDIRFGADKSEQEFSHKHLKKYAKHVEHGEEK